MPEEKLQYTRYQRFVFRHRQIQQYAQKHLSTAIVKVQIDITVTETMKKKIIIIKIVISCIQIKICLHKT